jgi:hypothetical protein
MPELHDIYLAAFRDRNVWTIQDHDAGLRAVFAAGAAAQRKRDHEIRSTDA